MLYLLIGTAHTSEAKFLCAFPWQFDVKYYANTHKLRHLNLNRRKIVESDLFLLFYFHVFIRSSETAVRMLLQNRAVFRLGLRMCSTHVTKGPLMDVGRPSSGKIKLIMFTVLLP